MHFAQLGIPLVHVHLGHAAVSLAQLTSVLLICLILLARNVLFLLFARNDVVEVDLLALLLYICLAFLAQLQIFVTLRVQPSVLLIEPFVLEVEVVLLPLGNLLGALMRVHRLLECLFGSFLVDLQFAHARLHHLELALFLALNELHLELATGRLMLHRVN